MMMMQESTVEPDLNLAKQLYMDGDWRRAEEAFEAVLAKFDQSSENKVPSRSVLKDEAEALLSYAELLVQKERKEDSVKYSKSALRLVSEKLPAELEIRIQAALILVESLCLCDDFTAAEVIVEDILLETDLAEEEETATVSPASKALLLSTSASLKIALEDFEGADSTLEEAIAICAENDLRSGIEPASVFSARALLYHLLGEFQLAEDYFDRSVQALEKHPHCKLFQDICFGYTTLLVSQSRFQESISFLENQIETKEAELGTDHPLLKRAICALAISNAAYGQLDEAEVQAQRYNRIVEMMSNAGKELKVDCLRTLVDILVEQSRYSEAEILLTRAFDIMKEVSDDNLKASILSDLARLKIDLADYAEAEELCKKALELTRAVKGEEHLETAMCWSILGSAYFSTRKIEEAEKAYRRATELIEKHSNFLTTFIGSENYRNLAVILTHRGAFDEAEELFLKILAAHSNQGKPAPIQVAETHKNLGELYELQDRNKDALMEFERAHALASEIYSNDNCELTDFSLYIADILRKEERFDEARKIYEDAIATLEKTLGPSHPKTCTLLQRFGELAIEEREYESAQRYFTSALQRLEQTLGSEHPEIGYVCYCLAAAYHWQDRLSEAESHYRRALKVKEKQLGKSHRDLGTIIEPLIDILKQLGRSAEAASLHRRLTELSGYDSTRM